MTDDISDIFRGLNAALLGIIAVGMIIGWWMHRDEAASPLGIAAFTLVLVLGYGSLEALFLDAGGGARSALIFVANLIVLVCVYIPLIHSIRHRKEKP